MKGNVRDENEAASAEAHHAERDGYIGVLFLPQDLPTVTAARKALEENSAGFAEKITRVFELAQQARWDEALPLFETTLEERELTAAGQWVRWWLMIDARRHEDLRREVSEAITTLSLLPIQGEKVAAGWKRGTVALPWQREIDETHISALQYLAKSTMFDKLPTRQQHHAAGECSVKARREMIEDLSRRLRQLRRKLRN